MKSWLRLMLVASTAVVLAACGSDDDDAAIARHRWPKWPPTPDSILWWRPPTRPD